MKPMKTNDTSGQQGLSSLLVSNFSQYQDYIFLPQVDALYIVLPLALIPTISEAYFPSVGNPYIKSQHRRLEGLLDICSKETR